MFFKDPLVAAPVSRRDEDKDSKESGHDEGYEFVPPDFDEAAFVKREHSGFRTMVALLAVAAAATLASYVGFLLVGGGQAGWLIGLAFFGGSFLALRFVFPKVADISHYGRKEWLGSGLLLFFSWLALFTVAVNPPITDIAPPSIQIAVEPGVQVPGQPVTINVLAVDNWNLDGVDVRLVTAAGAPVSGAPAFTGESHGLHTLTAALPAGTYRVEATATDSKGQTTHLTKAVLVEPGVLTYEAPPNDKFSRASDALDVLVEMLPPCDGSTVHAGGCIRTVYLHLTTGVDVSLEYDPTARAWIGKPTFAGFAPGRNEFTVVAETPDHFLGTLRVPGGRIETGPYNVTIETQTGDYQPSVIGNPTAPLRATPGLEVGIAAAALLGFAALRRRR